MFDLVISHYGCKDGATASWLIWRKLEPSIRKKLSEFGGFYCKPNGKQNNKIHPNSVAAAVELRKKTYLPLFIFVQHGDIIDPSLYIDQKVAVFDLNLGDQIVNIANQCQSLLLIDHHDITIETLKKNQENLRSDNIEIIVDQTGKECAASLLYHYLYPKQKLHGLIEIVKNNDIGLSDKISSDGKAIMCYLRTARCFRSFQDIEDIYCQWSTKYQIFVRKGRDMLSYQQSLTKAAAKKCDIGRIYVVDRYYTLAYVQSSILHSDIADQIRYYAEAKYKRPIDFIAVWKYNVHKATVSVSLRNPSNKINLSVIAEHFGGGGKETAAAFRFDGIENFHKIIERV